MIIGPVLPLLPLPPPAGDGDICLFRLNRIACVDASQGPADERAIPESTTWTGLVPRGPTFGTGCPPPEPVTSPDEIACHRCVSTSFRHARLQDRLAGRPGLEGPP